MALQYLDGATIPYFVTLRSDAGVFQGSWSMVNTVRYQQGDPSSAILLGADGTQMGLQIIFDEIDWASCDPLPAAYGTDEEIMTYLNTYLFTGQQGTLVPPSVTTMNLILSEPVGIIDNGIDGVSYMALSSTQGIAATAEEAYTALNFNGNTTSVTALMSNSSTDSIIDIELCKYDGSETTLLKMSLAAGTNGVVQDVSTVAILSTDYLYYKITVPVGTGTVYLSPIALEITTA